MFGLALVLNTAYHNSSQDSTLTKSKQQVKKADEYKPKRIRGRVKNISFQISLNKWLLLLITI